jgi:hypothetical protein
MSRTFRAYISLLYLVVGTHLLARLGQGVQQGDPLERSVSRASSRSTAPWHRSPHAMQLPRLGQSGAGKRDTVLRWACVPDSPSLISGTVRLGRRGRAGRASSKAEPGAGSAGRGAAQGRRLDPIRVNSAMSGMHHGPRYTCGGMEPWTISLPSRDKAVDRGR